MQPNTPSVPHKKMEKLNPLEAFVAWLGTSMWTFYVGVGTILLMVIRWVTGVNSLKELVVQHSAQIAQMEAKSDRSSKEGDSRFNKLESDLSHISGLLEGMSKSLDQALSRLNSKE